MGTTSYYEILNQVHRLTPDEQRRLLEELAAIVRRNPVERPRRHSILELEGLGEEVWRGIDAKKYVDEERDSWDG